ncbi:hypothetical protein HPP92_005228 [Vanilla planifolia]|uniref:FHA domain-containing protein n=1 Tax=Vanilla planifolia TaxID=51239 RepID=A0A835VCF2_VANPL|nr:hypothetical protein HPP92_005228 [Vanilla planifolia]
MELEVEGGNSIPIGIGSPTIIGRLLGLDLGPSSSDRTISRRHLSLHALSPGSDEADINGPATVLLQFEVIGKNPILVFSSDGTSKRVFGKTEKGTLKAGDRVSLSIKSPRFFVVKRKEERKARVEDSVLDAVQRRERRTQQRRKGLDARARSGGADEGYDEVLGEETDVEIDPSEISLIDPVKELGFLVKGHEFDRYPKNKIRPFEDWNWFLEELRGESSDSDEDDGGAIKSKGMHQKTKRGSENDDEEWMGQGEHQEFLAKEAVSIKRPRYSTRSKNPKKSCNNLQGRKKDFNVVDADDETLGGFIVDDDEEDVDEEEAEVEEEEEEEEEDDEQDFDID